MRLVQNSSVSIFISLKKMRVKGRTTRALLMFLPLVVLVFALLAGGAELLESRTIYRPTYEIAWAYPTNYGERYTKDINGVPVYNQPIIVLHETVSSAADAIRFFQTPHYDENEQASYHTLIKLDGKVVYIVPSEKRAFGAGNSVFDGSNGPEAVKTHPKFPPSVNNFAYHAAFETPSSGRNNNQTHSGYTEAQYRSLAWLIAQASVPDVRITTHRAVDRSGERIDPRSFDFKKFLTLLHYYRQASAGKIRIVGSISQLIQQSAPVFKPH